MQRRLDLQVLGRRAVERDRARAQIEVGVEAVEHREPGEPGAGGPLRLAGLLPTGLRGLRPSRGGGGGGVARQIGVEIDGIERQSDAEARPLSRRNHQAAREPAQVHAQIEIADRNLPWRPGDAAGQGHPPQPIGRNRADIGTGPLQQSAQVVGRRFQVAVELGLAVGLPEAPGQTDVRAAGKQRRRPFEPQFALAQGSIDAQLPDQLAAVDQGLDRELEPAVGIRRQDPDALRLLAVRRRGRGLAVLPGAGRLGRQKLIEVELGGVQGDPGIIGRLQQRGHVAGEAEPAELEAEIRDRGKPLVDRNLALDRNRLRQGGRPRAAAGHALQEPGQVLTFSLEPAVHRNSARVGRDGTRHLQACRFVRRLHDHVEGRGAFLHQAAQGCLERGLDRVGPHAALGGEGAAQGLRHDPQVEVVEPLVASARRIAVNQGALLDRNVVEADVEIRGARTRRATRAILRRTLGKRPVAPAVGQHFEQDFWFDQKNPLDLNGSFEQREQRDAHPELLELHHGRLGAALHAGQAYALSRQGRHRQERQAHIPLDRKVAPGRLLHLRDDAVLMGVPVDQAGPDQNGCNQQGQNGTESDQDFPQGLSLCPHARPRHAPEDSATHDRWLSIAARVPGLNGLAWFPGTIPNHLPPPYARRQGSTILPGFMMLSGSRAVFS